MSVSFPVLSKYDTQSNEVLYLSYLSLLTNLGLLVLKYEVYFLFCQNCLGRKFKSCLCATLILCQEAGETEGIREREYSSALTSFSPNKPLQVIY